MAQIQYRRSEIAEYKRTAIRILCESPEHFTDSQLGAMLGCTPSSVSILRREGGIPDYSERARRAAAKDARAKGKSK